MATSSLAAVVTTPPEHPTPMAVTTTRDVLYTCELKLDVYAPADPGPWPVAVYFHGDSVTKTYLASLSHMVAECGMVVFTTTWRSRLPFESEIKLDLRMDGYEDAASAIRFAWEKAAGYGGDPAKVTAVGHSAGGGPSAIIALAGDNSHGDRLVKKGSALVDGMVGLDGAYNLNQFVPENLYQLAAPEDWAVFDPFSTSTNSRSARKLCSTSL